MEHLSPGGGETTTWHLPAVVLSRYSAALDAFLAAGLPMTLAKMAASGAESVPGVVVCVPVSVSLAQGGGVPAGAAWTLDPSGAEACVVKNPDGTVTLLVALSSLAHPNEDWAEQQAAAFQQCSGLEWLLLQRTQVHSCVSQRWLVDAGAAAPLDESEGVRHG